MLFRSYKDPVKTAETFPTIRGERYSVPGDWCTVEADGTLTLLGRGSVCINTAGEKVYPEEVEDTLTRSKLIGGCAVVGLPDERLGAKVVAFVEPLSGDLTPDQLDNACLQSGLARFKRPREYVLVKAIPRSASGKLLRRKLRTGEYEKFQAE